MSIPNSQLLEWARRDYVPNRYICSVLDEMRTCHKTRNYSYLKGLIEEAQTLANRMEAAIGDKYDVESYREQRSELKDEVKKLREEIKGLKQKKKENEELFKENERLKKQNAQLGKDVKSKQEELELLEEDKRVLKS